MRRFALCATLLGLCAACGAAAYGARARPASRTFQFRYHTVIKEIPAQAGKVELWLPLPSDDAHQKITDLTISAPPPISISRDPEYHNSVLYLHVDHPAQPEIPVDVTFTVTRNEYVHRTAGKNPPHALNTAERARYLQPDRLVPIDGKIRDLAMEVTKGKTTDLEKTRAIYDYVTHTLKYDKSGTGWGRGDAIYACDARHGNCTDFHSLIIGMARSAGLPARFEIGFPLPEQRGSGEIPGYHCWAEIWTREAGWIPVDSSEASKHPEKFDYFFGATDENRIQFSLGRDLTLKPKQAGEPLNYFVYPYVEIDGKPSSSFDKQFSFVDKPASSTETASLPASAPR